jgi:hypothetical protein
VKAVEDFDRFASQQDQSESVGFQFQVHDLAVLNTLEVCGFATAGTTPMRRAAPLTGAKPTTLMYSFLGPFLHWKARNFSIFFRE